MRYLIEVALGLWFYYGINWTVRGKWRNYRRR